MKKSTNYFRKVAASEMPEWRINSALGDVKDAILSGQIGKSPGAMFTYLIKEAAKSESIII